MREGVWHQGHLWKIQYVTGLGGRISGPLDQTGSDTSGNRSQISQGKSFSPLRKSLPPPPGPLPASVITVCEEAVYSEEAWGISAVLELVKPLVGVCPDSTVAHGQRAHKIPLTHNLSTAALFISVTPNTVRFVFTNVMFVIYCCIKNSPQIE